MRIQFVYDSTNFTNQGVTSPIIISQLRYRPYPGATTVSWAGGTWPSVQIDMATSPNDFLGVSGTFANNLGVDLTTVHNGAVTVQPGSCLGAGIPCNYYIDIPLTTNFIYDPTTGNDLTLDIYLDGTGWTGTSRAAEHVSLVANNPLCSRIYNTTGLTATTGTVGTHYGAVCEFTYVPAAGLYPSFTASPRTGPVGQVVNFTDQTYTSDPGGVVAWLWDVNGDNVTDYTTQNCQHTYTSEGSYNVSLTTISGLFGSQALTRNSYIVIDAVDASFAATTLPGNLIVFNDTSTGNPTSWAWDFTNDGVVDATTQNTAFQYPGPGSYNCKLTVSDAFSTDTTIVNLGVGIIPVPGFGSTFSGTAATRGFWFQSPTRFSIISASVPDETNNGTQNVAIYRLTAPPPVFSATATGGLEFVSVGQPSNANIPCVVSFDAGEYVGVLGACGTTTMLNSYGTPTGPYNSSVLGQPTTLTRMGTQFNLNTTLGTTAYWQEPAGAISRVILGVTACAAIPYGTGTPSGAGPAAPTMKATALPYVGQTATLEVTQNDTGVLSFMVAGFGRASLPSPFGTILINQILVNQVMNGAAVVGPGTYPYSFTIPNDPTLVGVSLNWQNANLLVATSQVSLSNGNEFWIDL